MPTIHSWMELFEAGTRSRIPHIPFIFPVKKLTLERPFESKHRSSSSLSRLMACSEFDRAGSDLIALSQVTTSYPVYITSSPQVASIISAKTTTFNKPLGMFRYQAINIFGLQLVSTSNGTEHRRHKGVVKGCFNEAVMQHGWEEMSKSFEIMCKEEGIENGGVLKNVKNSMIKASRSPCRRRL